MYKSPIEIIQSDIQMKTEECIVKGVQKIGVNIDKDELIKALKYDRKQYEKGYADGIAATQKWIPCSEKLPFDAGYYLTTTTYNEVFCDYWNLNEWNRMEQVIAWMPLPEPYKGEP